MKRLAALPLILFVSACGDAPTELGSGGPEESSALLQQSLDYYPGCPTVDPQIYCDLFHGSEVTTFTTGCRHEECFDMTRSEEVRVVAADEEGEFPNTWFAWHEGYMEPWGEGCDLTEKRQKTRVEIPPDGIRCGAFLSTELHQYYEHFSSNLVSGCLAWIECKVLPVP